MHWAVLLDVVFYGMLTFGRLDGKCVDLQVNVDNREHCVCCSDSFVDGFVLAFSGFGDKHVELDMNFLNGFLMSF